MAGKAQNIVRALLHCVVKVIVLFCLLYPSFAKADSSIHNSGFSLSVGHHLLCVVEKYSINMNCTLRVNVNNAKSKLTGWNISWRSEGEIIHQNSSILQLQNSTIMISTLTVYVNWPKDKVFTCFAVLKEGNLSGSTLNASLTVSTKPRQTRIQGVRFIEGSEYKSVEIYWEQSNELNYTYSLKYDIDYDDDDDDDDLGGRLHIIDKNMIDCSYRSHDVYRVPNTTGYICKASIDKSVQPEYVEYRVYIIATRRQCQSRGPIRKFKLMKSGTDRGPDKYILQMIPHQASNFTVHVAKQRVDLTWTNLRDLIPKTRRYHLKYNCSELQVKNETRVEGETDLTLYSSDFAAYRPYAFCRFCIQTCLEASDVYSEPLCRETRLHEERPSEPPKITCIGAGCATTSDGRFRNVTVTWALPPRETWNGVLTHVTVNYRREENGSRYLKIEERNVNRGFTLLSRLERNYSYVVQTALCNKEGCSGLGNASVLPALPEKQQRRQDAKSSDDIPSSVKLSIGLASVVIGVIIVWRIRRRNKKNKEKQEPLPKLNEPNDYDNIFGDQMADKEYDVLSDDVLIEQGEINIGLEPLDDPQETSF